MALKCIKIMYDGDSVNNMVRLSYLIASLKETLLADNMPFFSWWPHCISRNPITLLQHWLLKGLQDRGYSLGTETVLSIHKGSILVLKSQNDPSSKPHAHDPSNICAKKGHIMVRKSG